MNITSINLYSGIKAGYSNHTVQKSQTTASISNDINANFSTVTNLQNSSVWNLSFKGMGVSVNALKPVSEEKLEIINSMLDSYKEMLPKAKRMFGNYKDIFDDCKDEARKLREKAYNENLKPYEAYMLSEQDGITDFSYDRHNGVYYYNEGVKEGEQDGDKSSLKKSFIFNVDCDDFIKYNEEFRKDFENYKIKKGARLIHGNRGIEYFEDRKGKSLYPDIEHTSKKAIICDRRTNRINEYAENITFHDADDGFASRNCDRKITFDTTKDAVIPAIYEEGAQHHQYRNQEFVDRIITFTTDRSGNVVPEYYYEDWHYNEHYNNLEYSFKAKRLYDGRWVVAK